MPDWSPALPSGYHCAVFSYFQSLAVGERFRLYDSLHTLNQIPTPVQVSTRYSLVRLSSKGKYPIETVRLVHLGQNGSCTRRGQIDELKK